MCVPCPHCGNQTELTLEAPAKSDDVLSAPAILGAFSDSVAPTRTSFFYQLGLSLVTLTMLILPIVYIAMVLVVIWGVYVYATHFTFLLSSTRGGGRLYLIKLMLYLGPLFVGAVLSFFMVKPLFAKRASRAQPLALNPGVEQTLYAFIAKICDLVGAPMPKRIDLDCQLNAAASLRRGVWSLFSNDLVLTIGVPLVAGLNMRQFAGVVAHEFGHFTQGFGMRLSYIIRSVNGWFARVVYERDAWDQALEEWGMNAEDWRVLLVLNCARLGVWFSRTCLMGLMFFGHGVSCFLLRQMEYDADSYEIKVAGSDAFEATAKRLAVLNEALEKSYKEIRSVWNLSRRLPDNLPLYLTHQESKIPPLVRAKIQDTLGLKSTGLFHTHPSDGDRIRCARRAAEPGIFHLEAPATLLFSNFDAVSRQVTHLHYAEDLGLPIDGSNLRPFVAPPMEPG